METIIVELKNGKTATAQVSSSPSAIVFCDQVFLRRKPGIFGEVGAERVRMLNIACARHYFKALGGQVISCVACGLVAEMAFGNEARNT